MHSGTTRSDPPAVQFKKEQFASMAAAKRQSEQSCLLEAPPLTEASNERVSLSQLATQRLGSLKWLMSRDLTISPLGKQSAGGTPGSAGGTPGFKTGGDSGDRGATWRSYTVDMSGAPSSVAETGTDGTVSKAPERRCVGHFYRVELYVHIAKAALVRNYLEVYKPCAGRLSTVSAIGTHLRDPINSGLTRWDMAV